MKILLGQPDKSLRIPSAREINVSKSVSGPGEPHARGLQHEQEPTQCVQLYSHTRGPTGNVVALHHSHVPCFP